MDAYRRCTEKRYIYFISNTFPENLAISHIPEIQQSERERERERETNTHTKEKKYSFT
jgi:hypothetical protein